MPWEPLGEWGRLGDDLGKLSPPLLGLFNCLYLTQFLTDFCHILDSKSYDQGGGGG